MSEVLPVKEIKSFEDYKPVNKIYITNTPSEDISTFETVRNYVNFALSCLALILVLLGICLSIIGLSILLNKDEVKIEKFNPLPASAFKDEVYYGKEKLFNTLIADMLKITIVTDKKDKKEIKENITATSRNYLFSGVPGTGKTQFVKRLVYLLDRKLAEHYKNEKKEYVRAFFVTPSMLLDKYLGETEKNIRNLFKCARNSKNWKATFIFLDEIDAFFGIRTARENDYSLSYKTEFLNLLSGINDDPTSNTFMFGASNRPEKIDPAFIRRMGKNLVFKAPDRDEILYLLGLITKNWSKGSNAADILGECADSFFRMNAAQAKITETCTRIQFRHKNNTKDMVSELRLEVQRELSQYEANASRHSTNDSNPRGFNVDDIFEEFTNQNNNRSGRQ